MHLAHLRALVSQSRAGGAELRRCKLPLGLERRCLHSKKGGGDLVISCPKARLPGH